MSANSKRWLVGIVSIVLACLLTARVLQAATLTFDVVSGAQAQAIEQQRTGLAYASMVWDATDTVLLLKYGTQEWLLNISKRSGSIAVRL